MDKTPLKPLFSVLLVIAVVAVAAMAQPSPRQTKYRVAGDPAPRPQMLVQTDWLAAHLNDAYVVVLHVGANRAMFDASHIPGARFLSLSDVAVTRNGIPNQLPSVDTLKAAFERLGVADKTRVVLYDDMSGLFAARGYFALDYLGHGNHAALLDGGLKKWTTEKRTVSAGAPAIKPAVLSVKPTPALLVDLQAMKQIVATRKAILIDARPADEYSGAKPSGGVPRAGHIPGAKNVFWMDNLVGQDNPTLKPAVEMRRNYAAAGVTHGKRVIVYCRTGVQAAHDYFTLKLLGFDPVLYEGSFFEWSNAAGTPVESGMAAAQ